MKPSAPLPTTTGELAALHCHAGAPRLTPGDFAAAAPALDGWSRSGVCIEKMFAFADFHATIGFVNALAWKSANANIFSMHTPLRDQPSSAGAAAARSPGVSRGAPASTWSAASSAIVVGSGSEGFMA